MTGPAPCRPTTHPRDEGPTATVTVECPSWSEAAHLGHSARLPGGASVLVRQDLGGFLLASDTVRKRCDPPSNSR